MEILGNTGTGAMGRNNAARITAVSISAVAIAFLFFGQFLGFSFDLDYGYVRHARRQLREQPSLNIANYGDPKSVVLRQEQGKIATKTTQLQLSSAEVNESDQNDLVQCDSINKKPWLKSNVKSVTIPEFWTNSNCNHDFSKSVTFFHTGKAGGGTVEREFKLSRIGISVSHPSPKPTHKLQLYKGPMTTLIFNIRDPVDRYVSAFHWGFKMLCRPGKMHNKRCESTAQWESQEWKLIGEKYKADPNVLAEALCEESPMYEEAVVDYAGMWFMGHKRPLTSWLDFLLDPAKKGLFKEGGIQHFFALPMEKQDGNDGVSFFNQHIQRLSLHLLEGRYDLEMAGEILRQQPEDTDLGAKARQEHSTTTTGTSTTNKSSALSPLGGCCMARQLQGDYELIQTMILGHDYYSGGDNTHSLIVEPLDYVHPAILGACLWGSEEQQELCRSDLRSMLLRRARYLDRSLGTCSDSVAGLASTA